MIKIDVLALSLVCPHKPQSHGPLFQNGRPDYFSNHNLAFLSEDESSAKCQSFILGLQIMINLLWFFFFVVVASSIACLQSPRRCVSNEGALFWGFFLT